MYRFSIFSFPKNYLILIKGQSEHSELFPDIRAVLFAIIDLLLGAKFITVYFIWGVGG